jgi:hypothetical protein
MEHIMEQGTLTVARHGYTCRQMTTLGHDGDGRLSPHVRLAATHVDAEGVTRAGCRVDTGDYPTFAAHMRDAHGVKPKRQTKTHGAPYPAGTIGVKPVRLTQAEREWLGADVTASDDFGSETGQVWSLAPGQSCFFIVREDGSSFSAHVSYLTRVEPASAELELPIAS